MNIKDEIRMEAQAIYRTIVTLRVNEMNGFKEDQLASYEMRFDKAVDWSIESGEFRALKNICQQMFSVQAGVSKAFRQVSRETFEEYFENPYILGKELRGEIR